MKRSEGHKSSAESTAGQGQTGFSWAALTSRGGALEIWGYRELIGRLVQRELGSRYKRSVLGWLWSMLNPAATLAIYALVFGVLLKFNPLGRETGASTTSPSTCSARWSCGTPSTA